MGRPRLATDSEISRLHTGALAGGAGPARAAVGGRDGGQLVRAGAQGRGCPAARRGRYRRKAERANRQRREPAGAPRPPANRAAQFTPMSERDSEPTTRAARHTARSARP
jgi:hypothetical protein